MKQKKIKKEPMNQMGVQAFYEAVNYLINSNRFIYNVLVGIKKVATDEIGTLGVMQKKGEKLPTLYYNPNFILKEKIRNPITNEVKKTINFSTRERSQMILHEALHILLDHCTRGQKKKDKKLANFSMDIIVNDFVFQDHPRYGQMPDYNLPDADLFDIGYTKGVFPETAKIDIRQMTFEDIYDLLEKAGHKGDDEKMQVMLNNGYFNPGEHNWEEFKAEADEETRAQLDKLIKDAIKQSNGDPGVLPAELQRYVDSLMKKDPTWKESLDHFARNCRIDTKLSTWKKPSRRYGFTAKGSRRDNKPNLVIGIDTSGSIYDDARTLKQFCSYLDFVLEECEKMTVICCDVKITEERIYEKGMEMKRNFKGGGGTKLQPIFDKAKEMEEIDGIVLLTDGYCENHIETYGINTLTILTPEGSPVGGIDNYIFFKPELE